MRLRWACMALLVSLAARASTVTYAVAIGHNGASAGAGPALAELRFADDDAVRLDAFFARLTPRHWLLAVLDEETQRRHPGAAAHARPPSLSALRELLGELAISMRADRARGDEPTLYLSYSGHGAQASDGTPFFALADGGLTKRLLYDEVLAVLPATRVHLFVDACHAAAVVGSRGLFSQERDAASAPLSSGEVASVVEASGLRRFPWVGALLASTEGAESHEWSQLEAGVFTHELLSALSGAADVNNDGLIEYTEVQAFVASANRGLKDPRAVPHVVAVPPALDAHTPLLELSRLGEVAFLSGRLAELGHFHVELEDGERPVDANLSADATSRLVLPAGRSGWVVTADREAELPLRARETVELTQLRFQPRSRGTRGSVEGALRAALFESPFGPTYYRGFIDSAGLLGVSFVPAPGVVAPAGGARRPLAYGTLGVSVAAAVASAVLGGLALQAKRDFDATDLMRPAAEASARYQRFGDAGLVTLGLAVALGLTGGVLWWTGVGSTPPAPAP